MIQIDNFQEAEQYLREVANLIQKGDICHTEANRASSMPLRQMQEYFSTKLGMFMGNAVIPGFVARLGSCADGCCEKYSVAPRLSAIKLGDACADLMAFSPQAHDMLIAAIAQTGCHQDLYEIGDAVGFRPITAQQAELIGKSTDLVMDMDFRMLGWRGKDSIIRAKSPFGDMFSFVADTIDMDIEKRLGFLDKRAFGWSCVSSAMVIGAAEHMQNREEGAIKI